jgi:hypothetical protein
MNSRIKGVQYFTPTNQNSVPGLLVDKKYENFEISRNSYDMLMCGIGAVLEFAPTAEKFRDLNSKINRSKRSGGQGASGVFYI